MERTRHNKQPALIQPPLCACGCGQTVKWAYWNRRWCKFIVGHSRKGTGKGLPYKYLAKHHRIWNENNPNDKISTGDGCIIHHKDENPKNNSPDNLLKMTDIEHRKHHTHNGKHPNQGKKFSKELCEKLSISHLGKIPWNKGVPGYFSEKAIESNRQAAINRHKTNKYDSLYNTKFECPYCGIKCIAPNYARWHGDKCKNKKNGTN